MTELDYGAFNTTLRIYENELLTSGEYDILLQMTSMESLFEHLQKQWQWPFDNTETNAELLFNDMLNERYSQRLKWIIDYAPNPAIVEWILLGDTYHNIKVLFKEYLTKQNYQLALRTPNYYPIYQLRLALSQKGGQRLKGPYQNYINQLFLHDNAKQVLRNLDVITDHAVLHHLLISQEVIEDEHLIAYSKMLVDHANALFFMRAVKQNISRQGLRALLDQITVRPLEDWLSLYQLNQASQYATLIDWFNLSHEINQLETMTQWEQVFKREETQFLAQSRMHIYGPLPMVAYFDAIKNEKKNLKLIATSIRNKIDPLFIKQRMCAYDAI